MIQKKLQPSSEYNQYDMDGDGVVDDKELAAVKEIKEFNMKEEKQDVQKRMAWVAIIAMLLSVTFMFTPVVPIERVNALADLIGLFFISCAGIAGAFMGTSAWMNKRK